MSLGLRIIVDAATILVMSGFCWLVAVRLKRTGGKVQETGYRTFLAFGITWVPIGIIGLLTQLNIHLAEPFLIVGIVFLVFGLVYRKRAHSA